MKTLQGGLIRRKQTDMLISVDRNQVDMTVYAPGNFTQLLRLLRPVVHTADQNIFKSDAPSCRLHIITDGSSRSFMG